MCKAHACMAKTILDQKLQTDQKLLGYASATMKQKICWELLANNVAAIGTGKICWELLSNNFASVCTGLTPGNITPTAYRKKKRHKPCGEVREVYDVILYGCAVILFSCGCHVSKNCKIKMTRKSLWSDFLGWKNVRNAVYHVTFRLTKFRKEWCLLSRIFIQCFLLLLCISWNSSDERLINRSSSSHFHIFWDKLWKKLLYSNVQHLIDYQIIIRITLYQRIKSNQILKLASN